ncbi:MAG: hypothetical protein IJ737_07935 [Ruminococcus sp.]|nr:hypothetical protein [Ruminococcus sp.]
MSLGLKGISDKIAELISAAGFRPIEDFTAVDSLIYKDEAIGFYSLSGCRQKGKAFYHGNNRQYTEADCEYTVRLMGRACEFSDFGEFTGLCEELVEKLLTEGNLLVIGLEIGKAYQSMPLRRLARDLKLTVRICGSKEDS